MERFSYQAMPRMALVVLLLTVAFLRSINATVNQPDGGLESLLGGGPLKELLSETGLKSELENLAKSGGKEGGFPLLNSFPKNIGSGKLVVPFKVPVPIPGSFKTLPLKGAGKLAKAKFPLKKVAAKKLVKAKVLAPKLAVPMVALKAKPKVHSLKPIVHIIEKPVKVYHKVPVPKKVLVPKFYPVYKPIPYPKIVPVPFKVPVKKIIPKIVKIPKFIPVPKFYPVKKPIPVGIPYPVPKYHKVPVPKFVPYKKYIPIPIPKKVPKFIPVPVKKIIKIPKPYYVPIKVPHITTSYIKTPMQVKVPGTKKVPYKMGGKKYPFKMEDEKFPYKMEDEKFPLEDGIMSFIKADDKEQETYKMKDADSYEYDR